jgi:hypothetical protein
MPKLRQVWQAWAQLLVLARRVNDCLHAQIGGISGCSNARLVSVRLRYCANRSRLDLVENKILRILEKTRDHVVEFVVLESEMSLLYRMGVSHNSALTTNLGWEIESRNIADFSFLHAEQSTNRDDIGLLLRLYLERDGLDIFEYVPNRIDGLFQLA